jgi:hypothetical protein
LDRRNVTIDQNRRTDVIFLIVASWLHALPRHTLIPWFLEKTSFQYKNMTTLNKRRLARSMHYMLVHAGTFMYNSPALFRIATASTCEVLGDRELQTSVMGVYFYITYIAFDGIDAFPGLLHWNPNMLHHIGLVIAGVPLFSTNFRRIEAGIMFLACVHLEGVFLEFPNSILVAYFDKSSDTSYFVTMGVISTQLFILFAWVSIFATRVVSMEYDKSDSVTMLFALALAFSQHVHYMYHAVQKAKYRRGRRPVPRLGDGRLVATSSVDFSRREPRLDVKRATHKLESILVVP